MNNLLTYLELPFIPEYLIEPIEDIINKPTDTNSKVPNTYKFFQAKLVDKKLEEFTNSIFNSFCYTRYQVILPGLHIHKDNGRNQAINYLLLTGGNAKTCFYDDDKNLLLSQFIPIKTWHQIRTDVFHNVVEQTSIRIAVSVTL